MGKLNFQGACRARYLPIKVSSTLLYILGFGGKLGSVIVFKGLEIIYSNPLKSPFILKIKLKPKRIQLIPSTRSLKLMGLQLEPKSPNFPTQGLLNLHTQLLHLRLRWLVSTLALMRSCCQVCVPRKESLCV